MRSWRASTLVDAAPELILGQVAEEALDHVEPTAAGGREVEMKALVARRPAQNRRVFVGGRGTADSQLADDLHEVVHPDRGEDIGLSAPARRRGANEDIMKKNN